MLYLKPARGLCNRLRAIASAVQLCKDSGARLCVVWGNDAGMTEKFAAVMQMPTEGEFSLVQEDDAAFPELDRAFSPKHDNFHEYMRSADEKGFSTALADIVAKCADSDYYIHTCMRFYGKTDYGWFRPRLDMVKIADEFERQIGGPYIGLHIRRTDNIKSSIYSPLYLFEETIRREISENEDARFFLATDDDDARKRLCALYGERIFTRHGQAARYDDRGLEDSMVDFILLSRSRKIFGSYWSSYSIVASEVGGVPVVRLKETDHDKIEQAYHDMLIGVMRKNAKLQEALNYCRADLEKARRDCGGMLIAWPVRKARGGVRCLRENGIKYTLKHAIAKVMFRNVN